MLRMRVAVTAKVHVVQAQLYYVLQYMERHWELLIELDASAR
jgi:hypothetical protein